MNTNLLVKKFSGNRVCGILFPVSVKCTSSINILGE